MSTIAWDSEYGAYIVLDPPPPPPKPEQDDPASAAPASGQPGNTWSSTSAATQAQPISYTPLATQSPTTFAAPAQPILYGPPSNGAVMGVPANGVQYATYTTQSAQSTAPKMCVAQPAQKPPEHHKKGNRWMSALEAVGGALETVGGAALTATGAGLSEVGIGVPIAALGVMVTADGAQRTVHGIQDTITGKATQGYITQGLEAAGMDEKTASRIDTGVSVVGMVAGGGAGLVKGATMAGGKALIGVAANGTLLADQAAPGAYYAATGNQAWTPLTVQAVSAGVQATGVSQDTSNVVANYTLMVGGMGQGVARNFVGGRSGAPEAAGGTPATATAAATGSNAGGNVSTGGGAQPAAASTPVQISVVPASGSAPASATSIPTNLLSAPGAPATTVSIPGTAGSVPVVPATNAGVAVPASGVQAGAQGPVQITVVPASGSAPASATSIPTNLLAAPGGQGVTTVNLPASGTPSTSGTASTGGTATASGTSAGAQGSVQITVVPASGSAPASATSIPTNLLAAPGGQGVTTVNLPASGTPSTSGSAGTTGTSSATGGASGTPPASGGAPAAATPISATGTSSGSAPTSATSGGSGTVPPGGSGTTSASGGNTGPSVPAVKTRGKTGMPLPPETVGGAADPRIQNLKSWREAARNSDQLVANADTLNPSARELALTAELLAEPLPGSTTSFAIVEGADTTPSKIMYGDALQRKQQPATVRTFPSFAAAKAAVEADAKATGSTAGQWVYRMEPKEADPSTFVPEEVQGAVHVDGNGDVMSVGLPNMESTAWLNRVGHTRQFLLGNTIRPGVVIGTVAALKGAGLGLDPIITRNSSTIPTVSGPLPSTIGYMRGGASRYMWFSHAHAMKKVLDLAAEGTPEGAKNASDKAVNLINRAPTKGAALLEPSAAGNLLTRIDTLSAAAKELKDALQQLPGAPHMDEFAPRRIKATDQTDFMPAAWKDALDTPKVKEVVDAIQADDPGYFNDPGNVQGSLDTLLTNLDRMDEAGLNDAVARGDATPEGRLLQAFPDLRQNLLDTASQRADIRAVHANLVSAYEPLIAKRDGVDGATTALDDALGALPGAPTVDAFAPGKIRPTADGNFVPDAWKPSVTDPRLLQTIAAIDADYPGVFRDASDTGGALDTLLTRLDRMDGATLEDRIARGDATPEGQLLAAFPDLAQNLQDTVETRAGIRSAHGDLYAASKALDANQAEGLLGSANSPLTTLGNVVRKTTMGLSTLTGLNWLTTRMYIDAPGAGMFDSLSFGSAVVAYKYSKANDALAKFNAKYSADDIAADPKLQELKAKYSNDKDKWNMIGDAAGSLGAFRSFAAAANYYASGFPVLGHLSMAQGVLTMGWVAVQRPHWAGAAVSGAVRVGTLGRVRPDPQMFTPAGGPKWATMSQPLKTTLRMGAITSLVAVPSVVFAMKYVPGVNGDYEANKGRRKQGDSPVEWTWDHTLGWVFSDHGGNAPSPGTSTTPSSGTSATPSPTATATSSATPGATTTASPTAVPTATQGTGTPPGGTPPTTSPSNPPTTPPTTQAPTYFVVDDTIGGGTFFGISLTAVKQGYLLTQNELDAARSGTNGGPGGYKGVRRAAIDRLFSLNPRYLPALADGVVTRDRRDPDLLISGDRIDVGPQLRSVG